MDDKTRRSVRNAIVFALADKDLTDAETQFIDRLRTRLGVTDQEFRELCAEVRKDRNSLSLPKDSEEVAETVALLRDVAAADGVISDREQSLLERIVRRSGLDTAKADEILSGGEQVDEFELAHRVDDIYAHYGEWPDAERDRKLGELAAYGRAAVVPLLRMLESYRIPDGMSDGVDLKIRVVDTLGELGDRRAVYYLCQQVSVAIDDETSSPELRYACAEAIGKIVDEDFTRDEQGAQRVRQWWDSETQRGYSDLVF